MWKRSVTKLLALKLTQQLILKQNKTLLLNRSQAASQTPIGIYCLRPSTGFFSFYTYSSSWYSWQRMSEVSPIMKLIIPICMQMDLTNKFINRPSNVSPTHLLHTSFSISTILYQFIVTFTHRMKFIPFNVWWAFK